MRHLYDTSRISLVRDSLEQPDPNKYKPNYIKGPATIVKISFNGDKNKPMKILERSNPCVKTLPIR